MIVERDGVIVLDGRALATRRVPLLAQRAEAVRVRRGRVPTLIINAFADASGRAPHVSGKLRACADANVAAVAAVVEHGADTTEAVHVLREAIAAHEPDGVFVQFPFPPQMDGDVVTAAIPAYADVDIMTDARVERYLSRAEDDPPVTVSAALLLLDEHRIDLRGVDGVIVADASPFATMFREAFVRRGADMAPVLDPSDPELAERLRSAQLVISSIGRPHALNTRMFARDAIAIDVGYFNEGGRGDIDTAFSIDHLRAIMPVPGGIGPMTVSALVERVVQFAESR